MARDHRVFERILFPRALELQHQALAQIPRADARRLHRLNLLQNRLGHVHRETLGRREFLDGALQKSVFINVADQHFGNPLLALVEFRSPHLLDQKLLKRLLDRQRIEHELPLLLVLGRRAHGQVRLRKMIAPFLIQLRQALELRLKIIHGFVRRLLGRGIKIHVGRRFRGIEQLDGRVALAALLFVLRQFIRGHFLEQRILRQLLFDHRRQLERGHLQHRERLQHLRCEYLMLSQPLR